MVHFSTDWLWSIEKNLFLKSSFVVCESCESIKCRISLLYIQSRALFPLRCHVQSTRPNRSPRSNCAPESKRSSSAHLRSCLLIGCSNAFVENHSCETRMTDWLRLMNTGVLKNFPLSFIDSSSNACLSYSVSMNRLIPIWFLISAAAQLVKSFYT